MRAADYGHEMAVEALVEAGADLKLRDNDGKGQIFGSATGFVNTVEAKA